MKRKTMKVKTKKGYQLAEVSLTKEGAKFLNNLVREEVKINATQKNISRS